MSLRPLKRRSSAIRGRPYSEIGATTIRTPSASEPSASRADDAATLALSALGWILADGERAQRFLDLTGLTPDGLRETLRHPATQIAVLDYLAAHEPDLLAAAVALQIEPDTFAIARQHFSHLENEQ